MLPKHPLARLLLKLSLLPFAWFAFLFWFEHSYVWNVRSSQDSPSGKTTAYLISLVSESSNPALAPYGLQVFLAPWWLPMPQRFGELAFAGYCNDSAEIAWQQEDKLVIHCATPKIKTPPTDHHGIHVELDSQPRPASAHAQGTLQVQEILRQSPNRSAP